MTAPAFFGLLDTLCLADEFQTIKVVVFSIEKPAEIIWSPMESSQVIHFYYSL